MTAPTSSALGALTCAALCATLHAQAPQLHAVFAASEHRGGAPAIAWLCEEVLPARPEWPDDLDPQAAYALTVSNGAVTVHPTQVTVPEGLAALGTLTIKSGAGLADAPLVWCCGHDGDEQWRIPASFSAPADWLEALAAVGADAIGTPRTISAPVLAGHLCGGLLEGDPRAALLRIGPALCGDVTWESTQTDDGTVVRGRSGGGLMLPLALLLASSADGSSSPSALRLRAFAARDGDRGEAARQLGRPDRELDVETLCALLHSEDELRLAAIRSLTRRGAASALPQILDAATPDMPWSTVAARDALFELWPRAVEAERRDALAALARNRCPELRGVDPDARRAAPGAAPAPAQGDSARARLLAALGCCGVGLFGLWRRERVRARLAPAVS